MNDVKISWFVLERMVKQNGKVLLLQAALKSLLIPREALDELDDTRGSGSRLLKLREMTIAEQRVLHRLVGDD